MYRMYLDEFEVIFCFGTVSKGFGLGETDDNFDTNKIEQVLENWLTVYLIFHTQIFQVDLVSLIIQFLDFIDC